MKTLSAVMSEKCNLNCSYCGVDKLSNKRIESELLLEQFNKLRQQYPEEIIRIDFFGGEPLINFDIIQYTIEHTKDDPQIQYFMPTNGLLLDEEKLDYLQKHNVQISISFDGLWQDTNRLQHNNKGTLDRYLNKAELFRKIKNFHIHTMVTVGNYNLLENHQFILKNMGANPDLTLVRDDIWDEESTRKINEGITELFNWYKANVDTEEMPNFIREYMKHVVLYKSKKTEIKNCGAGIDLITFSDNKTLPCYRFRDQPDIIAKMPEFREMTKCMTCEVKNYCRKGCLYSQIKNDGPIDELCDMYKHIYSEVFSMIKDLKHNEKFLNILKREISAEIGEATAVYSPTTAQV